MKLIKTADNIQIKMSKTEWQNIGVTSGWIKEAQGIDATRQVADTNDLYSAMDKMRNNISVLQNNQDANTVEATKDSILYTLNEIKSNNWVVELDAEIGLKIGNLEALIQQNKFQEFSALLDGHFKKDLDESKAQLDRQQQDASQPSDQQGVAIGLEEGGDL
jgi:hypothetical protein